MARDVPTIAARALGKLVTGLSEVGIDPGPLCREAGFDPAQCSDPDARVPVAQLHTLWSLVLAHHAGADAALVGATRYVPGDYALVGFVCMNSKTMGEALGHITRYLRLWTDEPVIALDPGGCLGLTYHTPFVDGPGLRAATEAAFAEILHGARLVLQTPLVPEEVCFTHPAPADPTAHDGFFGTRVRWAQARCALRFTPAQLALCIPRADPQLGEFLRGLANQALARHAPPGDSLRDELRALIAEELQKGVPDLVDLARRLATSERTLRRRLEAEGTTWRDLLDATRADLAQGYVRQRELPLSEVAFLVGFSEPSAFHRAFKRWTGRTPASYRLAT